MKINITRIAFVFGMILAGLLAASPTLAQDSILSPNPNQTTAQSNNSGYTPSSLAPITQNSDTTTIDTPLTVSCNGGGLHTDNSYLRRFDLAAEGVTADYDVTSVDIAIEFATSSTGAGQPLTVNIYSIAPADPLLFANLTLEGTATVTVADGVEYALNIPVTATVALGQDLVMEIFTPDGQATGESLFVGSNSAGQSAPTFIAAAACGLAEPTDMADIGFPEVHVIMVVNDNDPLSVGLGQISAAPSVALPLVVMTLMVLLVITSVYIKREQA